MQLPYRDRFQAGDELARSLEHYSGRDDVFVLALPRGGVPVGYVVAGELRAPLHLMLVRKLPTPGRRELAMGAVATGGVSIMNPAVLQTAGVSDEEIEEAVRAELAELERRQRAYLGDRPLPAIEGRTVLLVDDGLATGATMRAAVSAAREQNAAQVVVAVPVAPPETLALLGDEADEVVCPHAPEPFFAVGQWYEDFHQVSDEEVRELLDRAWKEHPEWSYA